MLEDKIQYFPFGYDSKFFQVKGNDLYYNTGTIEKPKYEILKRDYNKN